MRVIRVGLLAAVALAFPIAAYAVFSWQVDRKLAADCLSVIYGFGLVLLFSSSFWPLRSLRGWTLQQRLQSAALLFLGVSYATHLSWELGWLLLHERIAASPNAAWAYAWWAYIDGGDARYLTAPPELLAIEILSVLNGVVGVAALLAFTRGHERAVLVLMATAVVHLYSASFYYLSELVAGLPNVDTSSVINTFVKFGLANSPWVVMPWVVFAWGRARLSAC